MKNPTRVVLFLCASVFFSSSLFAASWYVSVSGSNSAVGSFQNPWSLAYALSRPATVVLPGDTIWVRGGTYVAPFSSTLSGTAVSPITVCNFPNERPTLLGNAAIVTNQVILTIHGQYTHYMGLEVTSNPVTRISIGNTDPPTDIYYATGIAVYGPSTKIINCVVHNCPGGGMGYWSTSTNAEVYGCLFFNNGYSNTVRGHGPQIYVQNNDETKPKSIVNSFIFNGFSLGIQFYSSSSDVMRGLTIDSCTVFNSGANTNPLQARRMNLLAGSANSTGGFKVRRLKVMHNVFYRDTTDNTAPQYIPYSSNRKNVELGTEDETLTDADVDFNHNHLYGDPTPLLLHTWDSGSFTNNFLYAYRSNNTIDRYVLEQLNDSPPFKVWDFNTYYTNQPSFNGAFDGRSFAEWKSTYHIDTNSVYTNSNPTNNYYFVRPNKYDSNKYYVTVQNYLGQNQVSVPLSTTGFDGTSYAVYDVQYSLLIPVDTGTLNGQNLPLNMALTNVAPLVGIAPVAPKHSSKTLGTFIVEFYPECKTIKPGNWGDPTIWENGKVPNCYSRVKVLHNVIVISNAWCKSVEVDTGATLTVKSAVLLNIGKQ